MMMDDDAGSRPLRHSITTIITIATSVRTSPELLHIGVFCMVSIVDIEKVQKRATKLIISLKTLPYKERLRRLKLPTLKYRRLRVDMIEVFKIIKKYV